MSASPNGKVVVVTGASAGIGREVARLFAREGARVVAAARRLDRLNALRDEVEAEGGICLPVRADVSERAQVQRLLDAALEQFGCVDIWVNNAGFGLVGSIEQTTPEEMERLWRTNYLGAFHGCQAALSAMRRQGRGHIINVSSMAARFPLPLHGAYTATKYALNGLSEALSLELTGSGIHVTTVMPGITETDFSQAIIKKIPDVPGSSFGRTATASEVAAAIVRCARRRRPRPTLMFAPAPPLTLALSDLVPGLWRAAAGKYVQIRTAGRGVPTAEETEPVVGAEC